MQSLQEMLARPKVSGKGVPTTSLKERRNEFNSNSDYWLYFIESVSDTGTEAKVFSFKENSYLDVNYPLTVPYFTVYNAETDTYERIYFSCEKPVAVGWIDKSGNLEYTDISECHGEVVIIADQFPTFLEMPETNGLTFNANALKEIQVSDSLHLYPLKRYSTPAISFWDEIKEEFKTLSNGTISKIDTQTRDYVALPADRWYGIYLIPGETLAAMNVCYVVIPFE